MKVFLALDVSFVDTHMSSSTTRTLSSVDSWSNKSEGWELRLLALHELTGLFLTDYSNVISCVCVLSLV